MNVLEWLLAGDPAVARATLRDLLGREAPYREDGLVARYLALQDPETGQWGGGVYSPKWVSTHYTMMELKDLGVDPADPRYQRGLRVLVDAMWRPGGRESKKRWLDACVAAMMLSPGFSPTHNEVGGATPNLTKSDFCLSRTSPTRRSCPG